MRAKICGALVVAMAVWASWVVSPRAVEAVPASSSASSELITLVSPTGDGNQQLIVIDPRVRTMSVYHVQSATGEVALKSARNFHWDLQLSHFNNTGPTPQEIRTLIEQPNTLGR